MARGGFPGMGGGMNINNLMKQAQKMQQQMQKVQGELEEKNLLHQQVAVLLQLKQMERKKY